VIGQMLGPYRVLEKLGEGGTGEVYKARDTRLDRTVAIKILPPELATGSAPPRVLCARQRPSRRSHHPHICTLFGRRRSRTTERPSSAQSVQFLVMEHLEGETLAERLCRSQMQLPQALNCATQIADALAAAHKQDSCWP
jgi:serine/threonine protein kinase